MPPVLPKITLMMASKAKKMANDDSSVEVSNIQYKNLSKKMNKDILSAFKENSKKINSEISTIVNKISNFKTIADHVDEINVMLVRLSNLEKKLLPQNSRGTVLNEINNEIDKAPIFNVIYARLNRYVEFVRAKLADPYILIRDLEKMVHKLENDDKILKNVLIIFPEFQKQFTKEIKKLQKILSDAMYSSKFRLSREYNSYKAYEKLKREEKESRNKKLENLRKSEMINKKPETIQSEENKRKALKQRRQENYDIVKFIDRVKRDKLTTVIVPDNYRKIPERGFADCNHIEKIILTRQTEIGNFAFENCSKLKEINIPEGTKVGKNVFKGCTQLKMIKAPKGTSIDGINPEIIDSESKIELYKPSEGYINTFITSPAQEYFKDNFRVIKLGKNLCIDLKDEDSNSKIQCESSVPKHLERFKNILPPQCYFSARLANNPKGLGELQIEENINTMYKSDLFKHVEINESLDKIKYHTELTLYHKNSKEEGETSFWDYLINNAQTLKSKKNTEDVKLEIKRLLEKLENNLTLENNKRTYNAIIEKMANDLGFDGAKCFYLGDKVSSYKSVHDSIARIKFTDDYLKEITDKLKLCLKCTQLFIEKKWKRKVKGKYVPYSKEAPISMPKNNKEFDYVKKEVNKQSLIEECEEAMQTDKTCIKRTKPEILRGYIAGDYMKRDKYEKFLSGNDRILNDIVESTTKSDDKPLWRYAGYQKLLVMIEAAGKVKDFINYLIAKKDYKIAKIYEWHYKGKIRLNIDDVINYIDGKTIGLWGIDIDIDDITGEDLLLKLIEFLIEKKPNLRDKNFISTSKLNNSRFLIDNNNRDKVKMKINVPKGTPCLDVSRFSKYGIGEEEIILPKDQTFKIINCKFDPTQKVGPLEIELELIPKKISR